MTPQPGSVSFLPQLLRLIEESAAGQQDWRIHPGIFSTILLDQIVRGGGVIIDVETETRHGIRGIKKSVERVTEHARAVNIIIAVGRFSLETLTMSR